MRTISNFDNSGPGITPIGLGAMPLSLANRPDEPVALEVIKAFINCGGNFIDTANVYCVDDRDIGHNEQLIRHSLDTLGKTAQVFVATKGGLRRPKGRWDVDASPGWLRSSCEKSLRDLNTDAIYLYQLHAPDPAVPFSDSIGTLKQLQDEGKILHIGLSNVNVAEIEQASKIATIVSVQNRCNILERKAFNSGVVDYCKNKNMVFIPHSPVGGHFDHARLEKSRSLKKIAAKHSASVYQVALAWLLHQGDHMLPIPGASKVSSITSSMAALSLHLTSEDLQALDKS